MSKKSFKLLYLPIQDQERNSHLEQSLKLLVAMPQDIESNQVNFHRVHAVSINKKPYMM